MFHELKAINGRLSSITPRGNKTIRGSKTTCGNKSNRGNKSVIKWK